MRLLLPFPLFLCPPLRTGSFPEAPHQACSEFTLSTRAGCWHSAVPAAQGAAPHRDPGVLPSPPGSLAGWTRCLCAHQHAWAQPHRNAPPVLPVARQGSGSREPSCPALPVPARAAQPQRWWALGRGLPARQEPAGSSTATNSSDFPLEIASVNILISFGLRRQRRRWRRHIPSRSFVTRPALGGGPAQG